jgi:hypothetical protein
MKTINYIDLPYKDKLKFEKGVVETCKSELAKMGIDPEPWMIEDAITKAQSDCYFCEIDNGVYGFFIINKL